MHFSQQILAEGLLYIFLTSEKYIVTYHMKHKILFMKDWRGPHLSTWGHPASNTSKHYMLPLPHTLVALRGNWRILLPESLSHPNTGKANDFSQKVLSCNLHLEWSNGRMKEMVRFIHSSEDLPASPSEVVHSDKTFCDAVNSLCPGCPSWESPATCGYFKCN